MMRVFALLAVIALSRAEIGFDNVSTYLEIAPKRTARIVNGQSAAENQFPHQALVFINTMQGSFQCGGSLINELWVLCAAHCIIGATSGQVLLGSVNRTSMPVIRNVAAVNRLSSYNPNTFRDDISLIKLDVAVPFSSNVSPILLPPKSKAFATYLNSVLTVSGFGLTTSNQVSSILQYTNVVGMSNAECIRTYGSMIIPSILCTRGYPNPNQGSCSGDSGGPLIIGGRNSTVIGIVSFGAAESCTTGYPQGFTRVGSYLSYISGITGIAIRNY